MQAALAAGGNRPASQHASERSADTARLNASTAYGALTALSIFSRPVFAPEDGTGGGGDGGDGGGDGGGGGDKGGKLKGAAGGSEGGDGAGDGGGGEGGDGAGKPYRPKGEYPDQWFGDNDQVTIDRLAKIAKDSQATISKRGSVPKDATGYSYTPSDTLKPYFTGDLKNDPALKAFSEAGFELGITSEQFGGFIEKGFSKLAEAGLLPKPFDAKAEFTSIVTDHKGDKNAASKYVNDQTAFAEGLAKQVEKDDPELAGEILALSDSRGGMKLLAHLGTLIGEDGIRPGGDPLGVASWTKETLASMDADPRIDPANTDHADPKQRFAPELRKQYDAAYKRLFA